MHTLTEAHSSNYPRITKNALGKIITGARDSQPVSGYTHNFYKYPARFSPEFVRAVIEAFSEAGDLVFDPFMGGGTALVEALALGRQAIGTDISALAAFVAAVKTTLLEEAELRRLQNWVKRVRDCVDMRKQRACFSEYAESGYLKHLGRPTTWRLRKATEQALASAVRLRSPRTRALARCIVLRTGQWALDGRRILPTIGEFRDALASYAEEMIAGARELREAIEIHHERSPGPVICLNRSAIGIEEYFEQHRLRAPKLIITSPPYPGIHVLYHRWQVDGRKETPAPFWIANKLDGAGSSYYTMGDRKRPQLSTYFCQLESALRSLTRLSDRSTTIVQMVGFSDPSWQLPRYLQATTAAGLAEIRSPLLAEERDGRLWRSVPNRKWHADQLGDIPASQEVVLFHRRAS
jgi:DNA modification methylase